jgi:signal transduction histidine kinase
LPAQYARNVDMIARGADRMDRMIRQLLDFTRVRFAAGVALERRLCDLSALCRELATDMEVTHPDRRVRCHAPDRCVGLWDRDRLGQVLSNLVGNAIRHGDAGQPIDIAIRDDGDAVALEVHNWGPPIPPDVLPFIWEPFRRGARPAEGAEGAGLGLGLYITHEIVTAHGGVLEVRSSREHGTTFTVRLPRELASRGDSDAPQT